MFHLGRIPTSGDEVELVSPPAPGRDGSAGRPTVRRRPARWLARVTAMDGRRIDTVSLQPLPDDDDAYGQDLS